MAHSLEVVSDAELASMETRAYREAARCNDEWLRAKSGSHLERMLANSANSALLFWRELAEESRRRASAVGIVPAGIY